MCSKLMMPCFCLAVCTGLTQADMTLASEPLPQPLVSRHYTIVLASWVSAASDANGTFAAHAADHS